MAVGGTVSSHCFIREDIMFAKKLSLATFGIVGVAAITSFVIAAAPEDKKPAAGAAASAAEAQLPPGWTPEDMQACMAAATPGEKQKLLTDQAGTWTGKTKMEMPDGKVETADCTCTVTPLIGGRYTRCEFKGDMPGMGPFEGIGVYGYDNVSKQYVSSWIDSNSTGVMQGTGELSADGKTITWNYTFSCPITKKPAPMREVETITGPNTKRLEMFGKDPKTNVESKMMTIELTKKT
jgi:hypothetical protein